MRAIFTIFAAISFLAHVAFAGELTNRFATIRLADGSSIDVPRSWAVLGGSDAKPLEDMGGAIIDLSPYSKMLQGSRLLLTVGTILDEDVVKLMILAVPFREATYSTIDGWYENALSEFDAASRKGLQSVVSITAWHGTKRVEVKGARKALVTEYTRPGRSQESTVQMFTIYGDKQVFKATFSCPTCSLPMFHPIFERIITSFQY